MKCSRRKEEGMGGGETTGVPEPAGGVCLEALPGLKAKVPTPLLSQLPNCRGTKFKEKSGGFGSPALRHSRDRTETGG